MATWYRIEPPKLWRDMTAEEKGALLLAHHEGKVIEFMSGIVWTKTNPLFRDGSAYRIRPEPKIETITVDLNTINATHRITFTTIDGTPDTSSIKMELIK